MILMLELWAPNTFLDWISEKVYFRSQILERPSIGECWNIFFHQYCLKMWYLQSLERAGIIQKLTILERKNGLVLANPRVPVSGTWSILSPEFHLPQLLPGRQHLQIFLKSNGILRCFNLFVNNTVVHEQTHLTIDILGKVIDVHKK